MIRVTILAVIIAAVMVFSGVALAAQTEHLISFQGQALDDAGDPVATGNLQVRIYNVATSGTPVYDSDQDFNNAIQDGIFDVLLGSGTVALNLDNAVKYYLEVSINGEEVVGDSRPEGRQEFWPGSGDYTHMHDADYVNVGEANSVTGGMIIGNSIDSTKVVDNTITGADLIGTNCSDICTDANTTDCTSCDSRFVNAGESNSVSNTMIVSNSIDSSKVQDATITGADLYGTACSEICTDANSGGDITAVNSGEGTKGGAASGDVTIEFACSEVAGAGVRCDGEDINVFSLSASDGDPDNAVYVNANGNVGIGTTSPLSKLSVGGSGDASYGVYGYGSGTGVYGTGLNYGVYGTSLNYGVYGTGGFGVVGIGNTKGGYFENTDTSGDNYGVEGASFGGGTNNYGGYFSANGATVNYGVYGRGTTYGGYFDNYDTNGVDYGVYARAIQSGGTSNTHYGGYFEASGAYTNHGIFGSGTTTGVFGFSSNTTGVYGSGGTYGVSGWSSTYGGYFTNTDTSGDDYGVYGSSTNGGTNNYGGYFSADGATNNYGVYATGSQYGVFGTGSTVGVYGGAPFWGVVGNGGGCDFDAVGGGTDYCASSSIRWKQNITEIDCALDKVESLQGVYFDWDEEHGGNRHDIGMIAEEVGKVLPEIVVYEEDGVYAKAMDYSKLTPLLVQAIKEQNKIIAQLKELVCLDHPDAEVCEQ